MGELNMIFKEGLYLIQTNDFWCDVFDQGIIKPERLLESKEMAEKVSNAISILEAFRCEMINQGVLEEL